MIRWGGSRDITWSTTQRWSCTRVVIKTATRDFNILKISNLTSKVTPECSNLNAISATRRSPRHVDWSPTLPRTSIQLESTFSATDAWKNLEVLSSWSGTGSIPTASRSSSVANVIRNSGKADLLKVHMVNHDMGLEKFMCNECDRLFSTWNTFYHHVMMTHEVWRTSYCTECKDKFATEAGLLRHRCRALNDQIEIEKIPSEKKPEKSATICEICGDMFVEKFLLKRHLETHLGSKDYHCHSCTRSYYSLESLKNHIKSIHEECLLKFPCEICGKEFSKQYKLSHHMKYHSDEKPYQCSICGVSYKEKGKLRKHFMNHTGEKPYPCAVCNRRFKDKPKLRQHMMTHTGERPYGCEMCGKRFPSRTSLQIHIMSKAHKGETPFTCDYCHRGFSRKPYMKLHMKRRNCVPNLDKNVHTNDFVAMFENEKNKCSIIGSGPMPVDLGAEEFVRSDPSLSFFDFKSFSK